MSATITEQPPAEIDGELSSLETKLGRARSIIDRANSTKCDYRIPADLLAEAQATEIAVLAEIEPLNAEYARRGGWTRYYLVEGGHLHFDVSSYRCSRQDITRHYWVTELSGQTADEAIEAAGERVCTVCFPQAPVAVQSRPSRLQTPDEQKTARERAERAQKRSQAAADRKAKGITDPHTGGDLRVDGDLIKTERAAAIEVVDQMWWKSFAEQNRPEVPEIATAHIPHIELLLQALAAKRGTSVEQERIGAEKRLAAKIKRDR